MLVRFLTKKNIDIKSTKKQPIGVVLKRHPFFFHVEKEATNFLLKIQNCTSLLANKRFLEMVKNLITMLKNGTALARGLLKILFFLSQAGQANCWNCGRNAQ